MTDGSVQIVIKPAFLEVSDGEVIIPITTNIPIELSPASPVLPKTPTKDHLPSNETTYIQHQIDLLRQELEKNITANNDFKNFINKKLADEKERLKMTQLTFYLKKLECLKRKTSVLKTKLKISKR